MIKWSIREKLETGRLFIIARQSDIILLITIILISLLSFAAGFIIAKQGLKTPLRVEESNNKND